ncbi:MAG: hypothetical protein ACYCYP_00045 [Leptospirales bacterium]
MPNTHLIIGSGGSVGTHLRTLLADAGDRVCNTHYHPRPAGGDRAEVSWIPFDLMSPQRDLPPLLQHLDQSSLKSLILFSHPSLDQEKKHLPLDQTLSLLPALEGVRSLFDSCTPLLKEGLILTIMPSLSSLKASGYLKARIYFGGLRGLLEEYSRRTDHQSPRLLTLELVHVPGDSTPHIPSSVLEQMARHTLDGNLSDSLSLARWIFPLLQTRQGWLHGETLRLPGGPFF